MDRSRLRAAAIGCAALAVALSSLPAAAYPRPGATELVSVASDGTPANSFSWEPSMSADGRFVAFTSAASNLVPGDTNEAWDVFVHDRQTGVTERVSVASDGTEAEPTFAGSRYPFISADGRFVAFTSWASNLVPDDTNGVGDVFVHDRETGVTERVSVTSDGDEAVVARDNPFWGSYRPSISADGRHVAFQSEASNLVPDKTSNRWDVFVHDRQTGVTDRVSVTSDGTEGNGHSWYATISADGRHVAFESHASNLVPDDTNGAGDVLVHDRETGVTERVSVTSDGAQGNGVSYYPSISADGRHVTFESTATNFVPGKATTFWDVYVHDRKTGVTERVSVTSAGVEGNNASFWPSISADGRYVLFESFASNLVPDDTNGTYDAFVHDRQTGITERVSVAGDGSEADSFAAEPAAISADGRYAVFESLASSLGPAGGLFVRDRGPGLGVGELSTVPQGDVTTVSGWATFSGQVVAAVSDSDDDGASFGPLTARDLGAELTGASLTYRPEQEDLLARLDVTSLPRVDSGGAPGVLYGLEFVVGETRYEIRALRAGATASPPSTAPHFALYRCDLVCSEQATLSGGIGTTAAEVRVSVPLAAMGASEGTTLTGARAFTAVGEATPGTLVVLDEADLPDATIPASQVTLGIAPAETPQDAVAFDAEAALTAGRFSGAVETSSLPAGDYRLWARACLGEVCGASSVAVRR